MNRNNKPVIFLAFANDVQRPLPKLVEEERALRQILEQAAAYPLSDGRIGLCETVVLSRATIADILNTFQRYRNRIAIFHYGGHANGYALLLESATGEPAIADADGLAKFLAQQAGLELIFLNGCATQQQAQGLLDAGVSVVIATSHAIKDTVATDFATRFYQGLLSNASLATAFKEAESGIEVAYGDAVRDFYAPSAPQPTAAASIDSPWELFYHPDHEEVMKAWTLGELAADPLFGLPPLPPMDLPPQPYRHLDYFRREHAHIFFGRGQQIRELYLSLVEQESDPLLLLYGQSGIGKSSFLAAGLLPRLERDFQVAYCRRDQSKGLVGSLRELLGLAQDTQSLAHGWHEQERLGNKPLIVVLDQIEECYTRPNPELPQEMNAFLDALQAIFGQREQRPRGKFILSFRKEWLAELETLLHARQLPFTNLFLQRLDRHGIMDAVSAVARVPRLRQRYHLTVADGLPAEIADDLLADRGSAVATTLQILLTKLWERAKARSYDQPLFDQTLYHELRNEGLLLSDFFDQQVEALRGSQAEVVDSGLALDLLAGHTTVQNTADECTLATLLATYPHRAALLPGLVRQCQDLYLLTDPAENQPGKAPTSRLAHDALAPLVRSRFANSDRPGQRARRVLENRRAEWEGDRQGAPLDERDLTLVEQGVMGMRAWAEPEKRLIHASRQARQMRQIVRSVVIIAGIIAVLAIVWQRNRAFLARDDAQINESQALAAQALNRQSGDPLASAALAVAALPFPTRRPYVPRAEFAYTEALQEGWEQQRLQTSTFLSTKTQLARQGQRLAIGGDRVTVITLPELQATTLITTGQRSWDVAWSQGGALLSYQPSVLQPVLQLWRDFTPVGWAAAEQFPATPEDGSLTCAAWHPQREQVAVCQGKRLKLWHPDTGAIDLIHTFTATVAGDTGRRITRWSPQGAWLVAWDNNYTLSISGAIADGRRTFTSGATPAHTRLIWEVAWSPDERYLVTVSGDGTAKVWLAAGLQLTATVPLTREGQTSAAFTRPVGATFLDNRHFLTWGGRNGIQKWSVAGEPVRTYWGEAGLVTAAKIVTATDHAWLYGFTESGAVLSWDLKTDTPAVTFNGHSQPILTLDRQQNFLATAGLDGIGRIWHATDGIELALLRGHQVGRMPGRRDLFDIFWLDEQHLGTVGADGTVRKWRFVNGHDPLCTGRGAIQPPPCYGLSRHVDLSDRRIVAAAWVSDTAVVSVNSLNSVQFWAEGQPLRTLLPPDEQRQVWLNANGARFFTIAATGNAAARLGALWRVEAADKPIVTVSEPISGVHWIGQNLLLNRPARPSLVIDGIAGAPIVELADGGVRYTAAQQAGQRLATADDQGVLRIWQIPIGARQSEWAYTEDGVVTDLLWLAAGQQLVTATDSGVVTLWRVQEKKPLWSFHPLTGTVHSLAVSPGGQWLAIAINKAFFVVDTASGAQVKEHSNAGKTISGVRWVTRPAWTDRLPTASLDMRLYQRLTNATGKGSDPQLLLMTWGGDGEVHFWHWDSLVEVLRLRESWFAAPYDRWPLTIATLSPNRAGLLTAGDSGDLRLWQIWLDQPETLLSVLAARQQLPPTIPIEP